MGRVGGGYALDMTSTSSKIQSPQPDCGLRLNRQECTMSSVPTGNGKSRSGVLTPRGQRTRAALIAAARTVFERDGFINARITDIAETAGTAHGSFYSYFTSKEE